LEGKSKFLPSANRAFSSGYAEKSFYSLCP
jgi:hypothetical protein